jgi:L-rhamnonate dehydratase
VKITGVEAVYPKYQHVAPGWRTHLWQIVVRIETDAGVTGLGYGGGGKASLPIVNGHFRELLLGQRLDSVGDIARLWDLVYEASIPYGRKGVAIMALSGVDLALWDALGKAEATPVYGLLGGLRRARVRAYATGEDTAWYHELGFTAHKFTSRWTGSDTAYEETVASAALARGAFGPDALIMVDSYMTWDTNVTLEMARRLAEFDMYWFEDIHTPDRLDEQAALRSQVAPVLIAGGEHEFTEHGFLEIERTEALGLWQPDITWCGGITAGLRIIELARQHGIPVVPHRGGEVWGLHLVAATDCEDLAEVLPGKRDAPRDKLWLGEPTLEGGHLTPPDLPGFGVTLNEALL